MLPSVVYISAAPSGMLTSNAIEPVKSLLPVLTTGAARRSVANFEVLLVASGVGVAVQPHSSPPSVLRAQAVRLRASG